MTRRRLRARDRRAVLVGLALIAPVAAYRAGIEPWLAYRSGLKDALLAERDLLEREGDALATAEQLPGHIETLQRELAEAESWLLQSRTRIAAAGTLTRYVTGAGQSAGILVQQAETRDAEEIGALLRPISLSLRALGDLEGILQFLRSLETGAYLVRVEELTLRPAGVNDGDLERGQLMAAGLVVNAYWLVEPAADGAMSFAGTASEGAR